MNDDQLLRIATQRAVELEQENDRLKAKLIEAEGTATYLRQRYLDLKASVKEYASGL